MKNGLNYSASPFLTPQLDFWPHIYIRATSQAPKRQARRGSQLVLMNLLTFLFQHLSSDLEYFYLEAAGLQKDRRGL